MFIVVVVVGFNILDTDFYCEPHSWGLSQQSTVKSLILPFLVFSPLKLIHCHDRIFGKSVC